MAMNENGAKKMKMGENLEKESSLEEKDERGWVEERKNKYIGITREEKKRKMWRITL